MRRRIGIIAALALSVALGCAPDDSVDSPPPGESVTTATHPGARELTPKEVFDIAAPSTVALRAKQGEGDVGGTGVVFDAAKGLILTNAHVISGTAALKA